VDENGEVSYTDKPPYQGAKPLDVPGLSSMQAPKISKKKPEKTPQTPPPQKVTKYTSIKIVSPENKATIRNSGDFMVSMATKPTLDIAQGHYISLSLDGVVVHKKLTTTAVNLMSIDRGTHVITAVIKNKKGKVLRKSKGVTVYVHRYSKFINPPKQPRAR